MIKRQSIEITFDQKTPLGRSFCCYTPCHTAPKASLGVALQEQTGRNDWLFSPGLRSSPAVVNIVGHGGLRMANALRFAALLLTAAVVAAAQCTYPAITLRYNGLFDDACADATKQVIEPEAMVELRSRIPAMRS